MPPIRDQRMQRLARAGVPPVGACEFRGVAGAKPRADTAGRVVVEQRFQLRAEEDDDGPIIEGLGTVYDTWAVIGRFWPFREKFARGAFKKAIDDGADVRSMRNHDPNFLLGRTASESLELWESDDGLHYRVHVNPDDPIAMSSHAQVMRGDIDGSSIWFEVVREKWTFATEDNGLEMDEVVVEEAKLFETGPVTFPAYETTTSTARQVERALSGDGDLDQEQLREALRTLSALPALLARDDLDLSRLAGGDDGDATNDERAAEEAPAPDNGTPPGTRHLPRVIEDHERLLAQLD